jgi:hypothetical protein
MIVEVKLRMRQSLRMGRHCSTVIPGVTQGNSTEIFYGSVMGVAGLGIREAVKMSRLFLE